MVKIENRRHDVVDQITKLVHDAYPPMFGHTVEYYIGEDFDTNDRFICFHLKSKRFGNLYRKTFHIPAGREVYEFEADFVGNVLSDFIMLGTTLLMNKVVINSPDVPMGQVVKDVLIKPFSKGMLKKLNLN